MKLLNIKSLLLFFLGFILCVNIASSQVMENKLSQEKSLYLKQHASNPVHWLPWGEEALSSSFELYFATLGASKPHLKSGAFYCLLFFIYLQLWTRK